MTMTIISTHYKNIFFLSFSVKHIIRNVANTSIFVREKRLVAICDHLGDLLFYNSINYAENDGKTHRRKHTKVKFLVFFYLIFF